MLFVIKLIEKLFNSAYLFFLKMVKRNVNPYTLFRLWSCLVVAEFIIMDLALKKILSQQIRHTD